MIDIVSNAAPLHDLGKIAISDTILLKEGSLTPEEFEIIKTHPCVGEETIHLAELKFPDNETLRIAKEIASSHHEKWNGCGYPRGLAGNDIPLWGRIMAVADVYDAIISKRAYKKPKPHSVAVDYLLNHKGTQFDPDVVDAFMNIADRFLETALKYAEDNEQRSILLG